MTTYRMIRNPDAPLVDAVTLDGDRSPNVGDFLARDCGCVFVFDGAANDINPAGRISDDRVTTCDGPDDDCCDE